MLHAGPGVQASRANRLGHTLQGHTPPRAWLAQRAQRLQPVAATKWELEPVVVAGAGIAGLSTALALHRAGIPVRVLEAAGNLRVEGTAIGLWDNAWRALEVLGVAGVIRPQYLALNKVELCRGEAPGRLLRSFSFEECEGGAGSEFRGVHRGVLLQTLADALPPDTITFNSGISRVLDGPSSSAPVRVQLRQDSSTHSSSSGASAATVDCGVLVGADGARSVTAQHVGLPEPNYAGYVAIRGVSNLGPGGLAKISMPRDAIRQVWGSGNRAGLYPLSDEEVYWFATFNAPLDYRAPTTPEAMVKEARAMLAGWGWNLDQIITSTAPDSISFSKLGDRWNPGPWGKGLVTLAGDAAHPMTPNLGQGGCTALEDAVVLAAELAAAAQGGAGAGGQDAQSRVTAALRRYEQQRAKRCVPLTIRAGVMGMLLQLDLAPVCLARDLFISSPLFSPSHFLDHCNWDVTKMVNIATPEGLAATRR